MWKRIRIPRTLARLAAAAGLAQEPLKFGCKTVPKLAIGLAAVGLVGAAPANV